MVYCTLFDSNYLDKGLVLYDSLARTDEQLKLYILALNDTCVDILNSEIKKNGYSNLIVVPLNDLENFYPELKQAKQNRTGAEYCWTTSSYIVKYVLEKYKEDICTYIDADMMFFSSAKHVIDDMYQNKCSCVIVPHHFDNSSKYKKIEKHVGTYCVEFNTFVNDENGMKILNWWAKKCLDKCYYTKDASDEVYGDQKYLNQFPEKFDGVYICEDYGVGIASWNISLLKYFKDEKGNDCVINIETNKKYRIVFCHYATIQILFGNFVNVNSGAKDKKLHDFLFDSYMNYIAEKRKYLKENYSLDLNKRRVICKNIFISFYHEYIASLIHLRRFDDIYKI